jgi:hypothetical protein
MTVVDQNSNELMTFKSTREARSFKGVLQYSGSFTVTHDSGGAASFIVTMKTDIYDGVFRTVQHTGDLDENVPYYYVPIDIGGEVRATIPCIDTGTEWRALMPCIDTGTNYVLSALYN